MSGKSSRDKGARGELQAAAALRALGIDAERAARNGISTQDLLHTLYGLHVEIKHQAKPDLWGAFRQAELDSRGLLAPVVIAKKVSRSGSSDWVVMHKLEDWPSVVASFEAARAKGLPPDA